MADTGQLTIWAVRYGNYEPSEVIAMYDNEPAARTHVESQGMDEPLEVEAWSVQSEFRVSEPADA